jgi:hypothetical protein
VFQSVIVERASAWRDRWPWLALALLAPVLVLMPVNQDSIWQVWVGRQMLHGARLYTDILEVNPPLLYWLALPQAALAALVGARLAVIGFCLVLIALSLYFTPPRYRLPTLAAAILLPLADFGKAEHFALIATIPYVFLISTRAEGSQVRHPWAIGFLGALGFAMKPYFIIVPLALELLVKRRIRPETIALAISAAAYAAAVLLFAPAYMTGMVPLLVKAYGSFTGNAYPVVTMFAFLAVAASLIQRRLSPAGLALMIAAVAFIPAVLIQGKWWPYQTVPARGFLFLAVAVELMRGRTRVLPDVLFVAAAAMCFTTFGIYRNPYRAETELHLRGVPPGASIAVLSVNPALAWPMVEDHHLKWSLSQLCLWQLPASERDPQIAADVKARLDRDLKRAPDVLVLDRRPPAAGEIKSMLPASYLNGYRLKLRTRDMESYVRIGAAF